MPRKPSEYRAAHAEAARIEPALARAVGRSMAKLRDRLSINTLAMALAAKDARAALALLAEDAIADALSPAGTIAARAVLRGGRIGADQVNKAVA